MEFVTKQEYKPIVKLWLPRDLQRVSFEKAHQYEELLYWVQQHENSLTLW